MAGHSFGAVTAQALGGQAFLGRGPLCADPRVAACVVMSPSPPRRGTPEAAFGTVKIPWMLMTGTADRAEISGVTAEERLKVFPALPATGAMYELVLDGAAHFAFTERASWRNEARNPDHHRVILALSTAFWDAHLRGDPAARAWLDGDGPRTILEPKDRFQRK